MARWRIDQAIDELVTAEVTALDPRTDISAYRKAPPGRGDRAGLFVIAGTSAATTWLSTSMVHLGFSRYAAALPSCLRTAAAALPTLSIASCSSSRDTPKCLVQYFTSCSSPMLMRLRSGWPRFKRSSVMISSGFDEEKNSR